MERPQVGVGILVVKGGSILLGKRKGSHGEGEYAAPGGHLEIGETIKECVRRELDEEVGPQLKIRDLRFSCFTNLRRYEPKHYADIGMVAIWDAGVPKVMEPHKIESWDWYPMDDPPMPLFGADELYIEAYRTGQTFFEN
jgi:8-oxo-dGTP diphosphatase